MLAESLDDIERAYQEALSRAGRPPCRSPTSASRSVFDPTLAPEGSHVVSMFTQWVPHTWADEPHAAELEAYADRLVARMEAVAPGFTDSVVGRQVIGPHTMQTEYGLVGGNIFHGELVPGQMFHCRPAAGYADLRTPIRGLYQAGSATHGGGGVTGIPGRNVVRQILRDRRACPRAAFPAGPAPVTMSAGRESTEGAGSMSTEWMVEEHEPGWLGRLIAPQRRRAAGDGRGGRRGPGRGRVRAVAVVRLGHRDPQRRAPVEGARPSTNRGRQQHVLAQPRAT